MYEFGLLSATYLTTLKFKSTFNGPKRLHFLVRCSPIVFVNGRLGLSHQDVIKNFCIHKNRTLSHHMSQIHCRLLTSLNSPLLRGNLTNIPQKVSLSSSFFVVPQNIKMRQKYLDTEKCLCLSYCHFDKIRTPPVPPPDGSSRYLSENISIIMTTVLLLIFV
jgi:hypothetical protein